MAFIHVDTDGGGSNTSPYETWAKATSSFATALSAASAGDTIYIQGAAADTSASSRTFASPGSVNNPLLIRGVKDGTTNEGSSVAKTDICKRGTDTLPHIETTGAGNDNTFTGTADVHGLKFTCPDRFQISSVGNSWTFNECHGPIGGALNINEGRFRFNNCEYEPTSTSAQIWVRTGTSSDPYPLIFNGGVFTFTANPNPLMHSTLSPGGVLFDGVDLSGFGNNALHGGGTALGLYTFRNCRLPATYTRFTTTPNDQSGRMEIIASTDDTSVSNTSSIAEYITENAFGTVEAEFTTVRDSGGSNDGGNGAFSYKMLTHANAVLEGTASAALVSPWIHKYVAGGSSITLTIHIANDSGSDLTEREVWAEFFTPDAGDTAQHDLSIAENTPNDLAHLVSTTAVTNDTSTWNGADKNAQKLAVTVTPGFRGSAFGRIYVAKREGTPNAVYVDQRIVVT